MSSSRALASYANARLDDAPLCQLKLQLGVERWCCLLCRRQFRSARHIGRHLERSARTATTWRRRGCTGA